MQRQIHRAPGSPILIAKSRQKPLKTSRRGQGQTRPGPTYLPTTQTRAYSPIGSRRMRCASAETARFEVALSLPERARSSPPRRLPPFNVARPASRASQPARRSRSLSRVRTRALPWALPPTPKPKAHRMSSSQVGRQVAREDVKELSVTLHPMAMQLSDSPCCGMPR